MRSDAWIRRRVYHSIRSRLAASMRRRPAKRETQPAAFIQSMSWGTRTEVAPMASRPPPNPGKSCSSAFSPPGSIT